MSSLSMVIAGVGAVAAAVGSGVLLARCFRAPRADLVAWSIALIGLLISLGSQTLGYLAGFDGAMFRAMELGAQVIAPLAVVLALSEVAARSLAARFCARVYIPSVAIVAGVILILDQLAAVAFTKSWPDPAVYYEAPPKYILMFAVGPLTALITLIAVGLVIARSGSPGWNAILPAQLAGGAAALLLAYPALVLLVNFGAGVNLPLRPVFTLFCAIATGLIWYAGVRTARLRLAALHGTTAGETDSRSARVPADNWDDRRWDRDDAGDFDRRVDLRGDGSSSGRRAETAEWGDFDSREVDHTGDIDRYQGDGHSSEHSADEYDYGWQTRDDQPGRPGSDAGNPDGDFRTGDLDLAPSRGWSDLPGSEPERPRSSGRAIDENSRADLFGQIAIYTLLEERVHEFDQLTQRVVDQVRSSEPDTLVFIVHAVPSAPMQRILYEVYRDRGAYEWHRQQPYVTKFEADRRPYVLATNVIELGLQQAKVSPFPSVKDLFGEPGYDTSGFERPDYLRDYGRPPASQDGSARSW